MKIIKVSPNSVNFEAGKVHLYSDFDGTYCPAKHSSLHDEHANPHMGDYCKKMNQFFNLTKDSLHFHITTGRTFGEYEAISYLLKLRNFRLPLPETLITKNGSDEYSRIGNQIEFYDNDKFPFSYDRPILDKNNNFKQKTNWDGDKFNKYVRDLASKYHFRIVEGESENSVSDYGTKSLFYEGKLNPDEWKRLPHKNNTILEHSEPIADYSIGLRKDGNLKTHITFSPDYGFCPKRNYIYDNFVNEIKKFLTKNNVKYNMQWEVANSHNFHRISCNITPEVEGRELTKLYDTKEALKKAIENNDIVVVAGDSSNDFEMLNPIEYLDKNFIKDCEQKSTHKEFYSKKMNDKLDDLRKVYTINNENNTYIKELRQELTENGYLKKIEDLPLYSIIIDKENSKLKKLQETFLPTNKIIIVKEGELDKGIEQAIINHSDKNQKFKDNLSSKIKSKILGIKKHNNDKLNKYLLGILLIFTAGFISLHKNIFSKTKGKGYEISNKLLLNTKQPIKTNDIQVNLYG